MSQSMLFRVEKNVRFGKIRGYVIDRAAPERRFTAELVGPSGPVGETAATTARPDLTHALPEPYDYGFAFPVPRDVFAAKKPLTFTVRIRNEPALAPQSVTFRPHLEETSIQGFIDKLDDRILVRGWVRDKDVVDRRYRVAIFIDGIYYREVVADRLRTDLLKAGLGDGRYGFATETIDKLLDGKKHMISAMTTDQLGILRNSPMAVDPADMMASLLNRSATILNNFRNKGGQS